MLLSTMFLLLLSAWLSGEGVRKKQVLQKFVADLETERSDLLVRCESAEAQVEAYEAAVKQTFRAYEQATPGHSRSVFSQRKCIFSQFCIVL